MKKICLIAVWMGKFPDTYPLWFNSVKNNFSIDFYIVTDRQDYDYLAPNVTYIYHTLDEVKAIFEDEMGIKIRLRHPYKLCDYKPIWWTLIGDKLSEYDFYGVCDMDLIFGDIRNFLTDDFLSKYDSFFDCGNLLIYRNNDEMKYLYRKSVDKDNMAYPYTKMVKTDFACYFDEFLGMSILKWQYNPGLVDQTHEDYIQDFSWKRLDFNSYITHKSFVFHCVNNKVYEIEVDSSGQIAEDISNEYMGKEFLLVHIQKRKMDIELDMSDEKEISDYWIYPNKYSLQKPEGPLYSDKDCAEYAEMIRLSDREKQLARLKKYGVIQYIPHFFRVRRIRKFIINKKGYF